MTEFSVAEQDILSELVRRRTTSFQKPPWMQAHRARAIAAEARRLIDASPKPKPKPKPKAKS